MPPIHRRSLLTAVILTLLPLAARAGGSAAPTRPNIVLIVADDLGYGELGAYGGTQIPTPHLDALARGGVRFTDGYVTAPFCAASRAALLTGRYQTRFGFEFNPIGAENADPGIGLPIGERTLAEVLRDAGYVTGLLGKWHLGGTARYHPTRRGFDEFFGFLHEGHYYVPPPWPGVVTWLRRKALPDGTRGRWASPDGTLVYSTHLGNNEPEYDADNPLLRNSQPVDERAYLTDALTREAVTSSRDTGASRSSWTWPTTPYTARCRRPPRRSIGSAGSRTSTAASSPPCSPGSTRGSVRSSPRCGTRNWRTTRWSSSSATTAARRAS